MYYLQMEYGDKVISIPFGGLKDADNYTLQFENREKMLSHIFRMLELNIPIDEINRIYLVSEKNIDEEFDYETCLPIKYSKNNFNLDSVKLAFIEYLQKDHSRIRNFGIIHVNLPYMMDFKDGIKDITDDQIRMAVNGYLKDDYKKYRDIYFDIWNDVNIRVDKVDTKKVIVRDDLSELESKYDDYVQYLIELSSRGDEEGIRAREELSFMDLEEIRKSLLKTKYGILDGLSDLSMVDSEDIFEFEELTNMKIDDLRSLVKKSLGIKDGIHK